jgi:hypothetical protein
MPIARCQAEIKRVIVALTLKLWEPDASFGAPRRYDASAEERDVPSLGSGRPFHAEDGYLPGRWTFARPDAGRNGHRGWNVKSRSDEGRTATAKSLAAAARTTRMRLFGLHLHCEHLNDAGILLHGLAVDQLRSRKVDTGFAHLVLVTTGMRRRA